MPKTETSPKPTKATPTNTQPTSDTKFINQPHFDVKNDKVVTNPIDNQTETPTDGMTKINITTEIYNSTSSTVGTTKGLENNWPIFFSTNNGGMLETESEENLTPLSIDEDISSSSVSEITIDEEHSTLYKIEDSTITNKGDETSELNYSEDDKASAVFNVVEQNNSSKLIEDVQITTPFTENKYNASSPAKEVSTIYQFLTRFITSTSILIG